MYKQSKVLDFTAHGIVLAWVEDVVNTLDDCDILEKVVNFMKMCENDDVLLSLKVNYFRSESDVKYVWYYCSCVVCEYHGYRRDIICMTAWNLLLKKKVYWKDSK